MSRPFKPIRFYKGGFIKFFMPWIKESGTPGDTYLLFRGQAVTIEILHEVADLGFPSMLAGPWPLTLKEVFINYARGREGSK